MNSKARTKAAGTTPKINSTARNEFDCNRDRGVVSDLRILLVRSPEVTHTRLIMEQEVRPRKNYLPQLLQTLTHKAEGDARAQILGRIALSITAIVVDVLFVPAMYSFRPLFALGAFAVLVLVSNRSREDGWVIPGLSASRLALFACFHLLLVLVANHFANDLSSVSHSYSLTDSIISAARILVVLPTLSFFRRDPDSIAVSLREVVATAIVLLAFFPDRYFQVIWPWYSRILTAGAALVCSVFVPSTHLVNGLGVQTIVGPSVDMVVDFACSGITGINLFHLLFGIVTIIEWNRLRKSRALISFFIGGLAYMAANFLRLNLLFLIGNLVSNKINLDFLGWVIFGITFYVLMKITYDWMVGAEQERKSLPVQARGEAA